MSLSLETLDAARRDPVVFARDLLGQPLFEHQVEVVRSRARYRVMNAGRRAGKTRVFGVLALWRMFAVPGSRVLIISAGDTSVKRTHAEIVAMVTGAVGTASSVEDPDTGVHKLTLSNGSVMESVPSSIRAARSADVDLLIVDEAGFVAQEVWQAAEPTIGARPGSRVIIASTPWMGPGHFFHDLWRQGMERPDAEVAAWHWPSTVNPMVDAHWLEGVRGRSASDYFGREYLAEWTSASGAYFDEDEIMRCVADYPLLDAEGARAASPFVDGPGYLRVLPAAAGVDWGMRRDANAVALVAPLDDRGVNDEALGEGQRALFVPYLAAKVGWRWDAFSQHVAGLAGAYDLRVIASELNGVGDAATLMLEQECAKVGAQWVVHGVWTDTRRKQAGFGKIKLLMQRGRLVLPRHPELLKQLRALEFESTQTGTTRIAVPENRGHDDLAMALLQAVSCVMDDHLVQSLGVSAFDRPGTAEAAWSEYRKAAARAREGVSEATHSLTGSGLWVPRDAQPLEAANAFWALAPAGREKGQEAAW